MPNREIVARFSSRIEAELACAMLREHGLDAHVDADDAGGQHPELAMLTGGARVAVAPDDAEEATTLLAHHPDEIRDDPADGDGGQAVQPGPRRRAAPVIIAIAVIIGLVVLADAVRRGGLLQLGL